MEFNDDEFDVAVSALVLNLVPDCTKAVAEMRRVVRPSGTVATYIWDIAGDGHPASPLVNAFTRLDPKAPRFGGGGRRIEGEQDIIQLFEEANLTPLATDVFDTSVRHKSFDDYWSDTLIAQGPPGAYIRGLNTDDLARLRQILFETVPSNDSGEVVYTARAWAIRGLVPEK